MSLAMWLALTLTLVACVVQGILLATTVGEMTRKNWWLVIPVAGSSLLPFVVTTLVTR